MINDRGDDLRRSRDVCAHQSALRVTEADIHIIVACNGVIGVGGKRSFCIRHRHIGNAHQLRLVCLKISIEVQVNGSKDIAV